VLFRLSAEIELAKVPTEFDLLDVVVPTPVLEPVRDSTFLLATPPVSTVVSATLLEDYETFYFGELRSFFGAVSSTDCFVDTCIGPRRFQNLVELKNKNKK